MAQRVVYCGYLGNAAAALYTYAGTANGHSKVMRLRLCNTDVGAIVVHVSIVEAGGTLSDVKFAEVSAQSLAAAGAAGHTWVYEGNKEKGGIILRFGEAVVAWAATANKIAARLEVEDVSG